MAIFRYIASDAGGKELRGAMDAGTAQEVVQRLSARGYRSVQVVGTAAGHAAAATASAASSVGAAPALRQTAGGFASAAPRPIAAPTGGGITFENARPEEIALFFRQMASLVHAGFSVPSALTDLAPRTAHRGLSRAAAEMGRATANGSALAPLMVAHPGLFAPHHVGLVSAGETGGFVEFAFEEAALGAEQDAALRQGLWLAKALIWNAMWTVLLLQPLFPSIDVKGLANGNGGVAALGALFGGYGRALLWVIPLGLGLHLAAWLIGKTRHQPFARGFYDRLSLLVPAMARLAKMRALASFTRVLRRLLMSGISPAPAFAGAVNAVPNAVLREQLGRGVSVVQAGNGIDAAIQATGLMGHDPLQMLVTGQRTGQWLEMLDRVTAFYQEEAARATEQAKAAQRRLGVILTLVVTGYVLCVSTYWGYRIIFQVTEQIAQ